MAGKGSFAYRGVDQEMPPEQSAAVLEHQQAVLLQVLRRRRGMGASFAELQDAGIEFPASVVSELELAGVPIERCVLRAQGASTVGVRLDPAWFGSPAPRRAGSAAERTIVRSTARERHRAHDRLRNALARCREVQHLAAVWAAAMLKALATAAMGLRDGPLRELRAKITAAQLQDRAAQLHDRLRSALARCREAQRRCEAQGLRKVQHLREAQLRRKALRLHEAQRLREAQRLVAVWVRAVRRALAAAAAHLRDGPLDDMRAKLAAARSSDTRAIAPTQWVSRNGQWMSGSAQWMSGSAQWMSRNAHHKRLLAPAALLGVIGLTIALVVGHLGASGDSTPPAHANVHRHTYAAGSAADGSTHTGTTAHAGRASPPTQAPVSSKLAAESQLRGHELLEAGEYTEATRLLDKALAESGKNVQSCLQPVSDACLTYAYALYDLGRALMLSGSPAAAVPVLERRLQIENQRPAVADTLEQARAQMG